MAVINDYLSAGGWMRRAARRDRAAVRYLQLHPGCTAHEVAAGLRRGVHRTHRRLRRLEAEGHLYSRWEENGFFTYTVYYAYPEDTQ